jgi:hypothetical protein
MSSYGWQFIDHYDLNLLFACHPIGRH